MEPFSIEIPDADLDDLHRRLDATRLPEDATESGWAQGPPVAWMRDLLARWRVHDWRARESAWNAVPQVRVDVGGVHVHALHLRSPDPGATPIVLTHGWPGTFAEHLGVARRLAVPDPSGASFHVVVPSLPGYGFSDRPSAPRWGVERIADAWAELMTGLGYDRFVAAGSDWGTSVSAELGRRHPHRIRTLALIPPLAAPPSAHDAGARDLAAARALAERGDDGSGYSEIHRTRPQTLGYALLDSPAGLAAWMGEKYVRWADPATPVPVDDLLDALSIYWLTGTAASSARLYRESIAAVARIFGSDSGEPIDVPVGAIMAPFEVPWISRRSAEKRFPGLHTWIELERGGHFASLEVPDAVAAAIRLIARHAEESRA